MSEKVEIVGIGINNITMNEGCDIIKDFLYSDSLNMIFTPNSEILHDAVRNKELEKMLNDAQLVIPDGIGVVIASKFYGEPLKERVAGIDLMRKLIELAHKENKNLYLLATTQEVIEEAGKKLKEQYEGLNIVCTRNGYFDEAEEEQIIEDINNKNTDILLVGLGSPKQERFIYKNRHKLNAKIAIGIGGSLDIVAGRLKRAPVFMQKAGLEWLYRLIKQPSRIKRIMKLPKFILLSFYDAKTKADK